MGNPPPASALAALMAPTTEHTRRIEIYESDGLTRWVGDDQARLMSGTVTVDYSRDERRAFDIELDNSDFGLVNAAGQLWYDKIIKAYRGVKFVDDVTTPIVTTRTNKMLNPNFTNAAATSTVRTNLCTNPNFEGNVTTGWSASAAGYTTSTIAASIDFAYTGTKSMKVTWPTAATRLSQAGFTLTGLTIGDKIQAAVYVRVPTGSPAVRLIEITAPSLGDASSVNDKWQRLNLNFTATATSHTFSVANDTAATSGQICYVDCVLLEKLAYTPAGPYFDGGTAADGTFTFAWTGTANLSTSTASAQVPTGCYASGTPTPRIYRSNKVIRQGYNYVAHVISTGLNTFFPGVSFDVTCVVGNRYTASMWVLIPPPPTGANYVALYTYGGAFGDAVYGQHGWTRISISWTATATAHTVGLTMDHTQAWKEIFVSNVLIEETTNDTPGSYFDGDVIDQPNRIFSWTGATNNSTSTEVFTTYQVTPTKTAWEIQVGEFMIDRISEANFPHSFKITGRDYTKKCLTSKFTQATQFATGQALDVIISSIAANAGITKKVLPPTGITVNQTFFFDRGTERWTAMKQIANAYNYDIFFDGQGYLRMMIFSDPSQSASSFTFVTGPVTGNLATYEKSTNDSRLYNHVIVTGDTSDSALPLIFAEAKNEDPTSLTNIARIGDRLYQYSSSFFTTQGQAQAVADSFLAVHALEEYELNFSSIVFPWFDTGEIIEFLDPNPASDDPDKFLLSSLNIPLGLGPMSANAKRVVLAGA